MKMETNVNTTVALFTHARANASAYAAQNDDSDDRRQRTYRRWQNRSVHVRLLLQSTIESCRVNATLQRS